MRGTANYGERRCGPNGATEFLTKPGSNCSDRVTRSGFYRSDTLLNHVIREKVRCSQRFESKGDGLMSLAPAENPVAEVRGVLIELAHWLVAIRTAKGRGVIVDAGAELGLQHVGPHFIRGSHDFGRVGRQGGSGPDVEIGAATIRHPICSPE
eukprot:GFKZ01009943.1.p1 GENE.GFKZ01009943.1~~GFKZ01009943.1.p1  ORF type:complete len:153 (-),score=8.45 GFKZ01009943.1:193-651(-)